MSSKRNKENDIVVSFVGGSRDGITGSCTLIAYPKGNGEHGLIALECGMIQGEPKPEFEYSVNKKMVENVPVKDVEGVFLLHAHVDHSGNLPIFCENNGFKGVVISSEETMYIAQDLLKDSVYLHDCLIKYLKSQGKRPKHLYTEVDMYNMFERMRYVDTHKKHVFNEYISYELYNSGHVLGGNQIKLYFKLPNNRVKTVVYTSDLGSDYNLKYKPYVKKKDIIPSANMYIFEATYANAERCFTKKEADKERKELKNIIKQYLNNGGRIFFPSFSFGRTQELQVMLYDMFKDEDWFREIPIVIDGKLTNKICTTYLNVLKDEEKDDWYEKLNWSNFCYNKDYKGTLNILAERKKGIYISSSGFIQAKTRSCDYVKNFMGSSKDLIVFVGFYGGEGSIGDTLINTPKGKAIKVDNTVLIKNCDVINFKTFSSHIQHDEIIDYWKKINTDKILVHHASEDGKREIKEAGKEELLKVNKTTSIVCVNKGASQFIL